MTIKERGENMDNKSLDFVLDRIKSGHCNEMKNNHYSSMNEIAFMDVVKQFNILFKDNKSSITLEAERTDLNTKGKIEVSIEHDSNADFEYFTMERLCCDGTLSFYIDLCESALQEIFQAQTFNKEKLPCDYNDNPFAYDLKYVVGNFVFLDEYGDEFASEDKPWMKSRFTVCLPIKMDFVKKEVIK